MHVNKNNLSGRCTLNLNHINCTPFDIKYVKSHLLPLREPIRQHVTIDKGKNLKLRTRIFFFVVAYLMMADQTSLSPDIFLCLPFRLPLANICIFML